MTQKLKEAGAFTGQATGGSATASAAIGTLAVVVSSLFLPENTLTVDKAALIQGSLTALLSWALPVKAPWKKGE